MSQKPVCVKCALYFKPEKNGIWYVEMAPKENGALPGHLEPDNWRPYKIWRADLWKCRGCGHEIITGSGLHPAKEDYELDFETALEMLKTRILVKVNDC